MFAIPPEKLKMPYMNQCSACEQRLSSMYFFLDPGIYNFWTTKRSRFEPGFKFDQSKINVNFILRISLTGYLACLEGRRETSFSASLLRAEPLFAGAQTRGGRVGARKNPI